MYHQLHCASKGGSERVVAALLQAGSIPDLNQPVLTESRASPLHIAAKHGHSGAAAALIRAGANVDCRDRNGWTPLHLASRFGRIEVSQQVFCVDRFVLRRSVLPGHLSVLVSLVACCCDGLLSSYIAGGRILPV